jgi:hypothetical protein
MSMYTNFFGIEIKEFLAQITKVALWLTIYQMNMQVSEEFGVYFARIPLKAPSHIMCAKRYKPIGRKYCRHRVAVMCWVIRHLLIINGAVKSKWWIWN